MLNLEKDVNSKSVLRWWTYELVDKMTVVPLVKAEDRSLDG
jgi:hypothetical protein